MVSQSEKQGTVGGRGEQSLSREKKVRTAFFKHYFLKFTSSALATVITLTSGSNINNFGGNTAMAQPPTARRAPTETPVQQAAREAVTAFKDFILAGNSVRMADCRRIFEANRGDEQFVQAFRTEFIAQVAQDRRLGPIVTLYKDNMGGGNFAPLEFLQFVDAVYAAASASRQPSDFNPRLQRELQQRMGAAYSTNMITQTMLDGVVRPLLEIYDERAGERLTQQRAGMEVATLFSRLLASTDRAERQTLAREITDLLRANTIQTGAGRGNFTPGFLDSLGIAFRDRCQDGAAVLAAYATDLRKQPNQLTFAEVSELFNKLPPLLTQLRTPAADRTALNRVYGAALVATVSSYVTRTSVPRLEFSVESVTRRLDEVRRFVGERMRKEITLDDLRALGATNPDRLDLARINTLLRQRMSTDAQERTRAGEELGRILNNSGVTLANLEARAFRGLDTTVADWSQRLGANPSREQLIALNNEVPTLQMLEELDGLISRGGRTVSSVINGDSAFYQTIGPRVWIPRLETLINRFKTQRDDRLLGRFATAMLDRYSLNIENLERLLSVAKMANTDIPTALVGLDELMRTSPIDNQQARLDAVSQLFGPNGQINRDIDALTNRIAAFYPGVIREEAGSVIVLDQTRWRQIRQAVARRLMIQFIPETTGDPVAALRTRYDGMARDSGFIAFRSNFTEDIDRHISRLGVSSPANEGERYINNSRTQMAGQARTIFQSVSMEYAYGIYQLLRETYGENWRNVLSNPDEMAKVCSIVANFSTLPPAYASLAMRTIGRTIIRNYDDATIAVIANAISGYSQSYIQGDFYHLLVAYYGSLPGKMHKLFPDITAVQRERREPTYDVRVRTPAEDPAFANIFLPAANIWVRVPKRIYEQWRAEGFLNISRSPDLTRSPAVTPDFLRVMSTMIERPMIEGRVNLPLPFIRLPILLQNIGALAPDQFPPVGEFISASLATSGAFRSFTSTQTSETGETETASRTYTVNAAQNFVREGAVTTGRQTYEFSENTTTTTPRGGQSTVTGGDATRHAGSATVQNLRLSDGYHLRTFDSNFELIGDRLQTIAALWSGMAPAGADTLTYFQRREEADGTQNIVGHVFQRFANGSFVEVDTVTLPREVAEQLYGRTFNRSMQRLYGGTRIQTGDVIAQMDGAVLFSGPGSAGAGGREDSASFQGVGGALQVRQWGGYTDYEHTREGRVAGAFGRFMAEDRAFWVGRVTAESVRADESGRRRLYFEGAYLAAERTEVRAFVGLATDPSWSTTQGAVVANHMFGRDVLGMRYGGIGGGRLIRQPYGVGGAVGREELGGGRIYGVSQDMINGFVASGLYRAYTPPPMGVAPPMAGGRLSVPPISTDTGTNTSIDNQVNQQHPELAQQQVPPQTQLSQVVVSAGVRTAIGREFMLETGAGWDILSNQGGAFANFDWVPMGETVSSIGLRAFFISRPRGGVAATSERQYIPIVGTFQEYIPTPGSRLTVEAHYPGIGELRLRRPDVELALGGGSLRDIDQNPLAHGAHGALRVPLTRRLTLGVAGSGSEDFIEQQRRLRQFEGITGLVYTLPYSADPGFRLASIFGSVSGIHQTEDTQETGTSVRGTAFQLDATGGLNWVTARSSLTGRLGVQWWQADWPTERATRLAGTAGFALRATSWMPNLGGTVFINPALTFDTSLGRRTLETDVAPGSRNRTEDVDFRFNFGISSEF